MRNWWKTATIALAFAGWVHGAQADAITHDLNVTPAPVDLGSQVTLELSGPYTDLVAFDLTIAFDPALLSVAAAATEATFPDLPGGEFSFSGGAGLWYLSYASGSGGITGDGPIMSVTFDTLAAGTTPVTVTGAYYTDQEDLEIPVNAAAQVEIRRQVPEPAATPLLLLGLAALALYYRRPFGQAKLPSRGS